MIINMNNKQYKLMIRYVDEDTTIADWVLISSNNNTTLFSTAKITRHHADPPKSKRSRRVWVITKLLKQLKLTRKDRHTVWEQIWANGMKVPTNF